MKIFDPKRIIGFVILILFAFSSNLYSQSSSFGNTNIFNGGELGIINLQHNFLNGGSGIQPGIIGTDRTVIPGYLSFLGTASWTAASDAAFVDGYVKTYMTTAFTFPIGDNGKYRPAAVSTASLANPANAAYYGVSGSTAITSRLRGGNEPVLPSSGPYDTTLKGSGVGIVDNVEYWDINGATSAKITLTWDATSVITSLSSVSILGWNGTKWVVISSTVDTTSLLAGTSNLTSGSITTNSAIVPDTYEVYTLGTTCSAGTSAPTVSSTSVSNSCPTITVNLNTLVISSTPVGASLVWFTNNSNTGPAYTTATTAVAGTYYAFYYDGVNDCYSPAGSAVSVTINVPPSIPTVATTTQPTCSVTTGTIVFTTQSGVEYSIDNGVSYQPSPTFAGLAPNTYTLKVRSTIDTTCSIVAANTVTINAALIKHTPSLTVSSAVCNGTTYNVSFNSNGVVTASTGTVTGTTITGIAVGTDVIVISTAVNGCASTQTTVVSPTNCVTPPIGCTTPMISTGSGVCSGTGTYSVSVTASSGATISASTGTVSGNSVTGIALGTVVTITASNGTCTSSVKVSSPTDCITACAGTAVSYSVGGCLGTTYNVSISNPNGATISASVGTVTATAIINIPVGTDITLTATAVGCSSEMVILSSPASCIIDAIDDTLISVNGITPSVILNDTLKGILPIIGTAIGNVKLTSTATAELSIDITTGVIIVTPNTPVGSYSVSYTICEINNPANCDTATAKVTVTAPDFLPSIIIDDVVFLTSGETRDFIVNISEFGFGSSIGQVVFVIPKLSAFTITNNPIATSSNVAGGTTINNNDWIITENSTFIIATLKPITLINNSSFSKIGFSISRKINIPSQTLQNLTITIKNGTGLDNVNTNNTYNVLLKAE